MLPPSTAYSLPNPARATAPTRSRSEGNSSSIILVPTLLLSPASLFVSRSFLHGLPRYHHPVHPNLFCPYLPPLLFSEPPKLKFTLFLSFSLRHVRLPRNSDEQRIYGITEGEAKFICISAKRYIQTYVCIYTHTHTYRFARLDTTRYHFIKRTRCCP